MKVCYSCPENGEQPYSAFPRNKRKPDGYDYQCKACVNKRMREAYARNPAQKISKTRQYHLDHPEWSKKILREWHEKNADVRYEAYKERGKDPVIKAKRREAIRRSESRRRAVKSGNEAVIITEEDFACILKKYDNQCWICGIALTAKTLHWDHYQPLSAGGKHVHSNMRPSCAPCNIRKNGIWPITPERLDAIRRAVRGEVMV